MMQINLKIELSWVEFSTHLIFKIYNKHFGLYTTLLDRYFERALLMTNELTIYSPFLRSFQDK